MKVEKNDAPDSATEWPDTPGAAYTAEVLAKKMERGRAEVERLRAELERERMRLAVCGVIAMANTPKDEEIFATVHYDDVYVKVNGQWKFAQRRLWPHTKAKLEALPPAPALAD